MGVEPFVYIADPEFLKEMSGKVFSRNWGKPDVFRSDRVPMLGECGLSMIEGNAWARHRHIITPAFSSTNLKVYMFNTSIMHSGIVCTLLYFPFKRIYSSEKKM